MVLCAYKGLVGFIILLFVLCKKYNIFHYAFVINFIEVLCVTLLRCYNEFFFLNPLLMSFLISVLGTTFLPSSTYAMEPIVPPEKAHPLQRVSVPPHKCVSPEIREMKKNEIKKPYPGMVGIIEKSEENGQNHNLSLIDEEGDRQIFPFSRVGERVIDKIFLLENNVHMLIYPPECSPPVSSVQHIVFSNGIPLPGSHGGLVNSQSLCSLSSNGTDFYVNGQDNRGIYSLYLYKNESFSPCGQTWVRMKWNGRTFEYAADKKEKNSLTVRNKNTSKTHAMHRNAALPLDSFAFFYINWDFTIYFYDPFSHALLKISDDGELKTVHPLKKYVKNLMPGVLYCQSSEGGGHLINAEGNPIEFNTDLKEIKTLRSTLSPPWAIYGYGLDKTTQKDTIFTVDLKGHVTVRGDFGLAKIQGIEPSLNDTLYIHGIQDQKDTVFLVRNNLMVKRYDATDKYKIVGIRSLKGYGAMPKILKEFKGLLSSERIINLCSTLKTIVPMYSDGPAFYNFFIPIAAQPNAGNTLKALDELFQTYENTSIDGYARIFIFKRSGGMDTIYKADPSTTTEQFLAQIENKINPDRFQKTLDAQKQLQKITNFIEGPLKNAYDKKLESVDKAVKILLNFQTK